MFVSYGRIHSQSLHHPASGAALSQAKLGQASRPKSPGSRVLKVEGLLSLLFSEDTTRLSESLNST